MREEDLTVRVRCEAVRANLTRVRALADSVLCGVPGLFSTEDREEILLALQECLTNVIRHAYSGRATPQVEVHLGVSRHGFRARIKDWGVPFDPAEGEAAASGPPGDGGYGLRLVRSTMDRVRRWRSGRTNWTELIRTVRVSRSTADRSGPNEKTVDQPV